LIEKVSQSIDRMLDIASKGVSVCVLSLASGRKTAAHPEDGLALTSLVAGAELEPMSFVTPCPVWHPKPDKATLRPI
jgi:hypothetical protein